MSCLRSRDVFVLRSNPFQYMKAITSVLIMLQSLSAFHIGTCRLLTLNPGHIRSNDLFNTSTLTLRLTI